MASRSSGRTGPPSPRRPPSRASSSNAAVADAPRRSGRSPVRRRGPPRRLRRAGSARARPERQAEHRLAGSPTRRAPPCLCRRAEDVVGAQRVDLEGLAHRPHPGSRDGRQVDDRICAAEDLDCLTEVRRIGPEEIPDLDRAARPCPRSARRDRRPSGPGRQPARPCRFRPSPPHVPSPTRAQWRWLGKLYRGIGRVFVSRLDDGQLAAPRFKPDVERLHARGDQELGLDRRSRGLVRDDRLGPAIQIRVAVVIAADVLLGDDDIARDVLCELADIGKPRACISCEMTVSVTSSRTIQRRNSRSLARSSGGRWRPRGPTRILAIRSSRASTGMG